MAGTGALRAGRFREETNAAIPCYAYLPFGGGPRVCVGHSFAMMEAHLLLATIASRYRLVVLPGHTVEPATVRANVGLPPVVG